MLGCYVPVAHVSHRPKRSVERIVGVQRTERGCKNSCVYGKQIFLIRNRYVKLCCRINDYAAVEYIFVLTVLPCRKIIYIIFDFFA